MRLNCWQYMDCGREPGGHHAGELGVCPVTTEWSLDGCNGGVNAGRACWVIAGTFCGGEPQGTFAKKYETCRQCEFFQRVEREEGPGYQFSASLLSRLVECNRV